MKKILLLSVFFATSAFSEARPEGIPSCTIQDTYEIRDDGPGKAIVTYSNSIEDCSFPLTMVLTSDNGIEVKIRIELGGVKINHREIITLEPLDPMMQSYPPEGELIDGEAKEFLIMGGVS